MKRRNKEALDVEYESEPESEKEPNQLAKELLLLCYRDFKKAE